MRSKIMVVIGFVAAICLAIFPTLLAVEKEFKIHNQATIKLLLQQHVGKRVILTLDSGTELSGVVTKVGDNLVQLSEPPRREFYDILVDISKISALTVRVRGL